jgi:hypothetical protein
MTRFRLPFLMAVALLLTFAGVALGHTATPTCGGTLHLDRGSRTADIIRTDTDPDQLVWDDVAGNGTYAVVPGIYRVRWSDGYVVSHLEVTQCEQAIPSPTATPKPTTPRPQPSATSTPSAPIPSGTPTPSPVTTPSPTSSPTPKSTSPAPSLGVTPNPTLPPTDRVDAAVAETSLALVMVGALLVIFAFTFALVTSYLRKRDR